MHIDSKEIAAYLEKQARKFTKNYDELPSGEQYAAMQGIAVVVIWDLIMDLDPEIKIKHIKRMK